MKTRLQAAALVVSCVIATPGFAADDGPHDDAIKARQAMMQLNDFNIGILFDMAKEKRPYDAGLASASAANLLATANLRQDAFWPQGSDSETPDNATNRALPAIWETYPQITEKADALSVSAETLNEVAANGLDALQGAIGDVGASCKACHDDYRAEKR